MAISDLVVDTDYPLDKVVYLNTGSYTIGGSSSFTVSLTHGLPFIPLPGGSWSTTSDFGTSYDFGTGTFPSSSPTYFWDTDLTVTATSTTIDVFIENISATPITVYYRVFAFEPSTDNLPVPPTASVGDNFLINSDYKNSKLYLTGLVTQAATGGVAVSVPITHGIGYIPQVLVWQQNVGLVGPVYYMNTQGSFQGVVSIHVDSSTLYFVTPAFNSAIKYHYRIYLDE